MSIREQLNNALANLNVRVLVSDLDFVVVTNVTAYIGVAIVDNGIIKNVKLYDQILTMEQLVKRVSC